jgi:alpha-D-xyloside xylohydrolase
MFYAAKSTPLHGVPQSREVYLPCGFGWYNFWTSAWHQGGQTVSAAAKLDTIPVFARAGSIVPLGPVILHVEHLLDSPYQIRVYTGADADFVLYEDAGDGYEYESGASAEVFFHWNERDGELSISERRGSFRGMIAQRQYSIYFIGPAGTETHSVSYQGKLLTVSAAKSERT